MNCAEIRQHIRDEIHRGQSVAEDPKLMPHLRECELCRNFCTDMLLGRSLRDMPMPEPRENFAAEAIQNAVNRHRAKLRRSFFLGFSAAAVLMIAIGVTFIFSSLHPAADFNGEPQTAVIMPAGGDKTVRIVILAVEPRQNATFTIDLSKNAALKNHPNQQRLQWQTDLPRGRNLLELPLVLRDDSEGYVNVQYRYDGSQRETRIRLQPEAQNTGQKTITS
ncbi:MAG: hypothetical protein K9K62_06610 [Desulfobacteraceae bacterium]|nr:hypothetical protein [Desulfobacteraceae bacterium]